MLVRFLSSETGEILMFAEAARTLLQAIGKETTAREKAQGSRPRSRHEEIVSTLFSKDNTFQHSQKDPANPADKLRR